MARTSDKRERLIEAAKKLIHHQGFNRTTLADIAQESGVPLGNVYYYFKTKDDIAKAVIQEHVLDFQAMAQGWDRELEPKARLNAYLDHQASLRDEIAYYGSAVGGLCQELAKSRMPLAEQADAMLKVQLEWAKQQFQAIGKQDADDLALQLIATVQGISLMANTLNDPDVLTSQHNRLKKWLGGL